MIFSKEELQQEVIRWQNRLVKSCVICKGVGSIEKPGTTKAIMCKCQEQSMLNAHLVAAGIPRKYLNSTWNWDGINSNKEATNKARNYSSNFIQNYFDGKGLYIYGRQGRGKSLLESLIARDVAAKVNPDNGKKFRVAFIIFEEFVQLSHRARSDFEARKQVDSLIENPDLLIIDNIGSETGTQTYNTKFLEFILRKRDNNSVPTIISSNYTPEQLIEPYSDTVHDFIVQNNELIFVQGDNHRKKTADLFDETFNDAEFLLGENVDE